MISLFAQLLSTSGAILIDEKLPIRTLFYSAGTLTIFATVILFFGLKEVHQVKEIRYFQSLHSNSMATERMETDHL